MNRRKAQRFVHTTRMAGFVASVACMAVLSIVQADKSRWFTISLLSYFGWLLVATACSCSFSIFRGLSKNQRIKEEHRITTSVTYFLLYNLSPLLGALTGSLAAIGISRVTYYLFMVTAGSWCMTFMVWTIIDPILALMEMALPSSRQHRRERLLKSKNDEKNKRLAQKNLLAQINAEQQLQENLWNRVMQPYAEKLAELVVSNSFADEDAEAEAQIVDIGVIAWQMGGLNCMLQLHSMALNICKSKDRNWTNIDYVSIWWDGIGDWRSPWFIADGIWKHNEEKTLLCSEIVQKETRLVKESQA